MAGQRNRRNKDAEMRRCPMSARPRSSQSDTQLEKISFSSTGKELQETNHNQTTSSQNQITAQLQNCITAGLYYIITGLSLAVGG